MAVTWSQVLQLGCTFIQKVINFILKLSVECTPCTPEQRRAALLGNFRLPYFVAILEDYAAIFSEKQFQAMYGPTMQIEVS